MNNLPQNIKTGFNILEYSGAEIDDNTLKTIVSLLILFQEDSLKTAGEYAMGVGRKNVSSLDMKKALMYQAKTFFEQGNTLDNRFIEKMQEINDDWEDVEEDEEEEGEEEEGEEEEGEEEEGEEEEGEEEEGEEEEECNEEDKKIEYKDLVANIENTYNTWDAWNPDDNILRLLKKSIDNVPISV